MCAEDRKYLDFSITMIFDFLNEVPLLSEVDDNELYNAAKYCKAMVYRKGETVFNRNETDNHVYFVYSGSLGEFAGNNADVNVIVKVRQANSYVGETAAMMKEAQLTTIIANERSILVSMPSDIFCDLMWKSHSMMKVTIFELISRLRSASSYAVNSIYLDAVGRLAFNILKLIPDKNAKNIKVAFTQTELANAAGVSRQTVAKILKYWRDEGWVDTVRGKLIINDCRKLVDIVVNSEMEI